MPIEYEIRKDVDLAIVTYIGDTSDDEFLSKHIEMSKAIDPEMDRIVDLRRANSISRTSDRLRSVAAMAKQYTSNLHPPPKVAIVAAADLSFGLARMFEVYSEGANWDLMVFRNMDEALEWIEPKLPHLL